LKCLEIKYKNNDELNNEVLIMTLTQDQKKRVKELEKIIVKLDTLFEQGEECINPLTGEIVLDNEYDALKKELFKLNPNSKIFSSITASETLM